MQKLQKSVLLQVKYVSLYYEKMNIKRIRVIIISSFMVIILLFAGWISGLFVQQGNLVLPTAKDYNFYFITDIGSVTGHGDKPQIISTMNKMAETIVPRYMICAGDNFHSAPAMSVNDTVWRWNFEQFFAHGYLKDLNWYTALGNHDYTGTPQCQIEYGATHPRWILPDRYYTFVKKTDDSTAIRFVVIDTNPFQTKYLKRGGFADIKQQNTEKQLHWMDSVLGASHEQWKVVIGHHPIVHSGLFSGIGSELLTQINPILKKHHVDFYLSGHVHSFQHLQKDNIDYMVGSTTWKSRTITPWLHSMYWKNETGFSICSVSAHHFNFYFLNKDGKVIYTYSRKK